MYPNRRSLLHIDDDPLVTRRVSKMLEAGGYESEAVNDPLQAVDALLRGQHRIVLLDIHMPKRSGVQILSDIKQLDAGIQVIILTGLINETTVLETMRLGARQCFFKPILDPKILYEAIDDAYKTNSSWWNTLHDLAQRKKQDEMHLASFAQG